MDRSVLPNGPAALVGEQLAADQRSAVRPGEVFRGQFTVGQQTADHRVGGHLDIRPGEPGIDQGPGPNRSGKCR